MCWWEEEFFFVVVVLLSFFRSSKWLFSPTHFSPTTTSVLGKITSEKGLNLYIFVDYIHYGGILLKSWKLSLGTVKGQVFSKNATWGVRIGICRMASWLGSAAASACCCHKWSYAKPFMMFSFMYFFFWGCTMVVVWLQFDGSRSARHTMA